MLSLELHDDYSPLNLTPTAPSTGQSKKHPSTLSIENREAEEVEWVRIVADCFNKYDNVHLEGCMTSPSIHEGGDLELKEMPPVKYDGLSKSYDKESVDGMEDNTDPIESSSTTMNIEDPIGRTLGCPFT